MWFKNLTLFQCTENFDWPPDLLNEKLNAKAIKPCGKTEQFSIGWTQPIGQDHDYYVHAIQGCYLLALQREERLLPDAVIRDALVDKINHIKKNEDREIYAKEKITLREDIIFDLLPKAFTKKHITYGYIDTKNQWIVINTASKNKAEEFCQYLRDSLGRLSTEKLQTHKSPSGVMTDWLLTQKTPAQLLIEDSCQLLDTKNGVGLIKFQQQDLSRQKIGEHIRDGHSVAELALSFNDAISFTLTEDLSFKKIKLLDQLEERRKLDIAETEAEQADADFALMTGEFSPLLNQIFEQFGGLARTKKMANPTHQTEKAEIL